MQKRPELFSVSDKELLFLYFPSFNFQHQLQYTTTVSGGSGFIMALTLLPEMKAIVVNVSHARLSSLQVIAVGTIRALNEALLPQSLSWGLVSLAPVAACSLNENPK